jgi:hypothetical protein
VGLLHLQSTNQSAAPLVALLPAGRHDRIITGNDLLPSQAERLGADVRQMLRYLNRLCER